MVSVILLLLVGGVGFAQVISDPNQVTLRWLRLGGIIALSLLAVTATFVVMTGRLNGVTLTPLGIVTAAAFVVQLLAVQLDHRRTQRVAAGAGFLLACGAAVWVSGTMGDPPTTASWAGPSIWDVALLYFVTLLSAGLMGGFLMTMLLGHAYLTAAGEMTQRPFLRLVRWLAVLLIVRAGISVWTGLRPYWGRESGGLAAVWDGVMVTARYLVGLFMPAVFTYMIYDCVKRRSNQSATGILYVTLVLVVIGEGAALALIRSTGLVF